jgi:hypothetical protein
LFYNFCVDLFYPFFRLEAKTLKDYLQVLRKFPAIFPRLRISGVYKETPGSDEILLGMGTPKGKTKGFVLDNKQTGHRSLSERVYHLTEEEIRLIYPPNKKFEDYTYYLDDLSPDTCFAFIMLYLLSKNIPLRSLPDKWLDYINRWEQGDVRSTGEPNSSWGCLHSVLAHESYSYHKQGDDGSIIHQEKYYTGLLDCLRLDLAILQDENIDPAQVPPLLHVEEYHRAITLLKFEQQKYEQLLAHSIKLQLEIPIKNSTRCLLVDALIATEKTEFMGVLKNFARTDTKNTWTGDGFGFMALYRPEAVGTGNDIVISVDPSLNIHLKDLWMKLEEMEDIAWEGKRPCDNPRFPDRSKANQPWYDEMGKYTLIGAPKQPSTKLSWEQVVHAIWELYHPARSIQVKPLTKDLSFGEPCYIYQCPEVTVEHTDKKFFAAKWYATNTHNTIIYSPTMKRLLAACIKNVNRESVPPIHALPDPNEFDFLEVTGGVIIIHRQGVFVLDDWDSGQLDLNQFLLEFKELHQRNIITGEMIQRISNQLKQANEEILTGPRITRSKLNKIMTKQKIEIREAIFKQLTYTQDQSILSFRKKVEERWGIISELKELYDTVVETEKIIQSYSESQTNHLIQMISIYGFPFVLFGGLFQFVFADIPVAFPNWKKFGIHYGGLGAYIILSIISAWILKNSAKKRDKKEK